MKQEQLILIDKNDNEIGTSEKIAAHEKGQLHRAFSIFIYTAEVRFIASHNAAKKDATNNVSTKILLQQRNPKKYHAGGLWTNACCGHPRPGETTIKAAARRLNEELGIAADLTEIGSFLYRAEFDNGLIEHELDHVFVGEYKNDLIKPHPDEISNTNWITPEDLQKELVANPQNFTPWFKQAFEVFLGNM